MVTYTQVVKGISTYIDTEILPQMTGFKKIALGVGSGIVLKKADNVYNILKENKIIHALDLVDNNGNINIELLKDEMLLKMGEEKYPIEIPMIGTLTINKNDVNKLYDLILNS